MTGVYVGRFAPSPTGPLHFGSLVAAVASFLDARSHGGQWLIRIEDIDPPREVPGAAEAILRTLERWQLHWDGGVLYQSTRLEAYRDVVDKLLSDGHAYRCRCTRRDVARYGLRTYPGICRNAAVAATEAHSIRVQTSRQGIVFDDGFQGLQQQVLATAVGDYVIWRRDGYCAYQLAVTVDDDYQRITHVVRGADLLDSSHRQIHLRQLLGLRIPSFSHLAVVLNTKQQKLSKQTGADPIDTLDPRAALYAVLRYLQQNPPTELAESPLDEQLEWAVNHWCSERLRNIAAIEVDQAHRVVRKHAHYAASQQPEVLP